MMRKIAYHTHNVGCLWNRLVKPVNFKKIILHFRPHQVPRDPSEGYPGTSKN